MRVQDSIQSQKQTLLLSCLSASRTDFDHRSLEGILLIVVQCKHAALSRGHSNDVTSVYGTCLHSSYHRRLRAPGNAMDGKRG